MAGLTFDPFTGLLPPGRWACSVDEIRAHLVDAIPGSSTRVHLFMHWQMHREGMKALTTVVAQWLGGSFVTAKPDPGDVDVVSFLEGPAFEALPLGVQQVIRMLTTSRHTKPFWKCDSYLVLEYPVGHPARAVYEAARDYWARWWGHTRTGDPMGFVEVVG